MENKSPQPRNTQLDSMEDIPREKVTRKDGLPTVDDMAAMLGKPVPEDEEFKRKQEAKSVFKSSEDSRPERSEDDISKSTSDLSDFIEIIVRIPKP